MESPLSDIIRSIYYFDDIIEFYETKTAEVHEENDILTIENLSVQIDYVHKNYDFLMRGGKYYSMDDKEPNIIERYDKNMKDYFKPTEMRISKEKWICMYTLMQNVKGHVDIVIVISRLYINLMKNHKINLMIFFMVRASLSGVSMNFILYSSIFLFLKILYFLSIIEAI